MKTKVIGYMCSIDWNYEIGKALGGSTIYPSVEDLKENHPSSGKGECGIIKVKIEFEEEIEKGKY